ncbi:MAG: HEPN domain-containing protein [Planctomycetes bacterium]|nr:HEPN domain-containing protein [Planctomycetota bacterium]
MSVERQAACAWLAKADHDRRTAIAALEQTPPITDTAAFHVQQAIEKLFKAFLVSVGEVFERVHDLEVLCNACAQHDPVFLALRTRVAPLTAYAVRFRYPGPVDPPLDKVQEAIDVLEEVRQLVNDRLADDSGSRPHPSR